MNSKHAAQRGGGPGVEGHEQPKVWVGLQKAGLTLGGACLIQQQAAARLKQGIQTIQNGRVAQVGILQQYPLPKLYGPCQRAVHPLKPASSHKLFMK